MYKCSFPLVGWGTGLENGCSVSVFSLLVQDCLNGKGNWKKGIFTFVFLVACFPKHACLQALWPIAEHMIPTGFQRRTELSGEKISAFSQEIYAGSMYNIMCTNLNYIHILVMSVAKYIVSVVW